MHLFSLFSKQHRYAPLHIALKRVHEAADVSRHGTRAGKIEQSEQDVMVHSLFKLVRNRVPIYGARPPSKKLHPIPLSSGTRLQLNADFEAFTYEGDNRIQYNLLVVGRKELDHLINAIERRHRQLCRVMRQDEGKVDQLIVTPAAPAATSLEIAAPPLMT